MIFPQCSIALRERSPPVTLPLKSSSVPTSSSLASRMLRFPEMLRAPVCAFIQFSECSSSTLRNNLGSRGIAKLVDRQPGLRIGRKRIQGCGAVILQCIEVVNQR